MRDISNSTLDYEQWACGHTNLRESELRKKHAAMAANPFAFLRATFYRWSEQFPVVCPRLNDVPRLLAVGDIHIENFGLWRDSEARLVWGVNDFDEAAKMPYASDLVRLVTSIIMAPHPPAALSAAGEILDGYRRMMKLGGSPYIIAERHKALREMAQRQLAAPDRFWSTLTDLKVGGIPSAGLATLRSSLPENVGAVRIGRRVAGMGSLGRPRAVAIGYLNGGLVAREVKGTLPSAWHWAHAQDGKLAYADILQQAVRAADPFFEVREPWVVRRLSPDNCKLELGALGKAKERHALMRRMGAELANTHGADSAPSEVRDHVKHLSASEVAAAAQAMRQVLLDDHRLFRVNYGSRSKPGHL